MRIAIGILVILVSIPLTGQLVGLGAQTDRLLLGAVPGALVLIGVYRLLGARLELVAWATFFSLAVAPAYLTPAIVPDVTTTEVVASVVMIAVALASLWISAWLLGVAFVVHVAWDFLPRALTPEFAALPVACLLFDLVIAAYIGWESWRGRWTTFALPFGAHSSR